MTGVVEEQQVSGSAVREELLHGFTDDVPRLVEHRVDAEVPDQRVFEHPGERVGVATGRAQAAQARVLELVAGHDQRLAPAVHPNA